MSGLESVCDSEINELSAETCRNVFLCGSNQEGRIGRAGNKADEVPKAEDRVRKGDFTDSGTPLLTQQPAISSLSNRTRFLSKVPL